MNAKDLMKMAVEARKKAYTPYSHYQVGATIVTEDGTIYTGCNIESASYTPTVCAERCAISKAVSEGHRHFTQVAVVGGKEGELAPFCTPCGVCRQLLAEFCTEDTQVYLGTPDKFQAYPFDQILPFSFTSKDLLDE